METLRELDLVRAVDLRALEGDETPCAFRAADDDADGVLGTMDVRFSPFKTWYRIASFWEGDFYERTWPGAFRKTIEEQGTRVRVQFDHGFDPYIGSKLLGGVVSLEEKSRGPLGVVELDDTSYNRDLLPGLKRGLYGSSFRFRVIKDEWNDEPGASEHNPQGLPERTIKEVRLLEFGPVTWPANPAATAGVRSATDAYYEALAGRDPKTVDDLRSSRIALLERTGAAPGTPALVGAAAGAPDEPTRAGHSAGMGPADRRRLIYRLTEGQ